ncbi:hypothetical protein N9L19_00835 [bacterium]|nr:hypothetical protein [bacterium]
MKRFLRALVKCKAADFQKFEARLQSATDQSIVGMLRQAKELPGVHAVVKHILMRTANVP